MHVVYMFMCVVCLPVCMYSYLYFPVCMLVFVCMSLYVHACWPVCMWVPVSGSSVFCPSVPGVESPPFLVLGGGMLGAGPLCCISWPCVRLGSGCASAGGRSLLRAGDKI